MELNKHKCKQNANACAKTHAHKTQMQLLMKSSKCTCEHTLEHVQRCNALVGAVRCWMRRGFLRCGRCVVVVIVVVVWCGVIGVVGAVPGAVH